MSRHGDLLPSRLPSEGWIWTETDLTLTWRERNKSQSETDVLTIKLNNWEGYSFALKKAELSFSLVSLKSAPVLYRHSSGILPLSRNVFQFPGVGVFLLCSHGSQFLPPNVFLIFLIYHLLKVLSPWQQNTLFTQEYISISFLYHPNLLDIIPIFISMFIQ